MLSLFIHLHADEMFKILTFESTHILGELSEKCKYMKTCLKKQSGVVYQSGALRSRIFFENVPSTA